MYIGLPAGFVSYNTVAHQILLHLHRHGPSTAASLAEDLKGIARDPLKSLSANLTRLHKHGFIYKVGRARNKPGGRSCALFSVTKSRQGVAEVPLKNGAVRTREYRARKAAKVASVFNFRGSMSL